MSPKRPYSIVAGILVTAVLLAVGAYIMLVPRPIPETTFNRIHKGMQKAQVEAMLGRPNWTRRRLEDVLRPSDQWIGRLENGDEAIFGVWYADQRVLHTSIDTDVPREMTVLDRLHDVLSRLF